MIPLMRKKHNKAIKSLKNNKRTGPDKVKIEFIKFGGKKLTKALQNI